MKNLVLALIILFFCNGLSQAQKCASIRDLGLIQKYDTSAYNKIMEIENHTASYINSQSMSPLVSQFIIYIPVVVHVLYNTSDQNISDDQIRSQLEVLNEDYNRLNADRINTPTAFSNVATSIYIHFILACKDPQDNSTSGITRTQTSINPFNVAHNADGTVNENLTRIKFTSLGGYDAWPRDRYLNIWSCNMSNGVLVYTQFPGTGTNATDGVVIQFNAFGRRGTLQPIYNEGRTATHEVGHWLNLIHIWGDDQLNQNQCSGSDLVDDTPNQAIMNFTCPSFPKTDACTSSSPGIMFMNYMDYSPDACMNLFTAGQSARMRSLFVSGGFRQSFVLNNLSALTGAPLLCTSSNYSVSNLPNIYTIFWSASQNITMISSQGSNPCTFQKYSNGNGTIYASIKFCDTTVVVLSLPVHTGPYSSSDYPIFGPSSAGCHQYAYYNVPQLTGVTAYNWTWPTGWTYSSGQNSRYLALITGTQGGTVAVGVDNTCGHSGSYATQYTAVSGCYGLVISPNPTSDIVNVAVIPAQTSNADSTGNLNSPQSASASQIVYKVSITDLMGTSYYNAIKNTASFTIPVQSLPNGNYIITVDDGANKGSAQLVIKH